MAKTRSHSIMGHSAMLGIALVVPLCAILASFVISWLFGAIEAYIKCKTVSEMEFWLRV
jgi:hypothetical protein